jgi:hypothetical protein
MLRNPVCLVYAFRSSFQSLEKTIAGTAGLEKLSGFVAGFTCRLCSQILNKRWQIWE